MNDIPSLTGVKAPTAADALAGAGKSILGKDDFLKIFLAQLAHQDPTSPVDSEAFVAQLAQFSSLELQHNANANLEAIMMGQAATQQTSVTNLVGKDVTYKADSVSLIAGQASTIDANLDAQAASLTAVITDGNGKVVRTLKLGGHAAGTAAITWDGRDDAGTPLPGGTYKVAVTASDTTGAGVGVDQRLSGHVTGVSFQSGSPELLLGSQHIKLSNVIEIKERTTP